MILKDKGVTILQKWISGLGTLLPYVIINNILKYIKWYHYIHESAAFYRLANQSKIYLFLPVAFFPFAWA